MALARRDRGDLPDLFRRFLEPMSDGDWLRVEEFREGNNVVVRADLPGVDPDRDVEVSVSDGVLHVRAHREERSESKNNDTYRSEFQYGSFTRNIALPPGVDGAKVKATYKDGVLEVRIPIPPEAKLESTKVPIKRS